MKFSPARVAFSAFTLSCMLLATSSTSHAQSTLSGSPQAEAASPAWKAPDRRRIYLMRHGDVSYFDASGQPVANSDLVILSEKGRAQADAAGRYLNALGISKIDRVYSSNLPRTRETAARVLAAAGIAGEAQVVEAWREMKGGGSANIPTQELPAAFLAITAPKTATDVRFLGGESVSELQQRVLTELQKLQGDPAWGNALLVLHGLVNNTILSHALGGGRDYFGRIEHGPGCINVLDIGTGPNDWVVRAINLCPDASNYADGVPGARLSTLEKLLAGSLRARATATR